MDRKTEIFKNVLTSAYDNGAFVNFVQEFLNEIEIVAPNTYNKVYNNFSYYVDGYYHIGNYTGSDGNKIAIFSVALKKGDTVERARTMQRNFIKPLLERSMCAGALVAFYTVEDLDKWRLSFIRLDYEFSKGKVTEKLTPARRYSYLVGNGEPCNTAKQRLFPIFNDDEDNPGINELEEAFSVEKVTNEFFQQYCEKFQQLREYLESNEEFIQEAQYRHFTSEQFAKKLLGQIVFLYFIQKKGWLGVDAIPVVMSDKEYKNAFYARGQKSRDIVSKVYAPRPDGSYRIIYDNLQNLSDEDEEFLAKIVKGKPWGTGPKDFMRRVFEGCEDAGKNYFDDYLEPLFYTGLNKNRGENGFYPALHRRIPFLNGGLFEELDHYEWENNNFNIPNSMFSNRREKGRDADGILDIFDRYNFTMNEDEPMEREVAIDPEMLGKVFENLLDVKDRKSKGAFYTPREIVHYMCQETLIDYLSQKTDISKEAIQDFILYGEYMRDEDTIKTKKIVNPETKKIHYEFDKNKDLYISEEILCYKTGVNKLKEIDDLLSNVKIADLAVGSGAFPLGMVNEIVKARQVLTEYMSIDMNSFQKKSFLAYGRKSYDLKVNTIKNCIFGCDIDPSAADIAKLRLWLSIVIDDEVVESLGNGNFDEHTKPKQLPNLDCNIICGNSLISEFKGNKLITDSEILNNESNDKQQSIFQKGVDGMIRRLIDLQDKLFFTKDPNEKLEIKENIQQIYNDIILEQLSHDPDTLNAYDDAMQEDSQPFILWQLFFPKVFKENGGFDIIIGNPPYIKIQNIDNDQAKILKNNYITATGKFDIYVLFVECAFRLINSNGIISFIQPHRFLNAGYGRGLRTFLEEKHGLQKIINFGVNQKFDTATTYTGIFFYRNNSSNVQYSYLEGNDFYNVDYHKKDWDEIKGKWMFEDNNNTIINKINNGTEPLLDVFKGVYQGFITLGDDKFILNGHIDGDLFYGYSNALQQEVVLESEIMKPVLKGENIRRYQQPTSNMYVIYLHTINEKGKTIPFEEEHVKKKYPRTYEYMKNFEEELREKKVKYKTNATYWYSLHRAREKNIFDSHKIITPQLQNYCNFAIDSDQMYPDAGGYMLMIKDKYKEDILYYYGILNSSLFYHFIKSTSTAFNNNYYYFKTAYIKPFVFPKKNECKKERIKELVSKIVDNRKKNMELDISEYEKEIDEIVYELYDLSKDEIAEIETKYNVQ